MTNSEYTAILIITDRSGSMTGIKEETQNGINTFIAEQAKLDGRCTVRLVQFDNVYEVVHPSIDVKQAPKYHLDPRGMTALHDAIGRAVTEFGRELEAKKEPDRPGKVIVVIATDGLENSSQEWTSPAVNKLIAQQRNDYSWEFIFMGANQDAILAGERLGIATASALTYTASSLGTKSAWASASNAVAAGRAGGQSVFTDEDREAAQQ